MYLKIFKFVLFLSLGASQEIFQLNQLILIDSLFFNKSDKSIATGRIYIDNNGKKLYLGEIIEGKKHGIWIEFYSNGRKKKEINFLNGLMNGPYTIWYKNGVKGEFGFYKNNKKDKMLVKWDQKGNKSSSITFKQGLFHGKIIFYKPDGDTKYEGIYHEGRCIHGVKKAFRHKGRFPNPVYEVYEDNKLIKLKWLDKEDRIIEITDCQETDCN